MIGLFNRSLSRARLFRSKHTGYFTKGKRRKRKMCERKMAIW